MSRTILAAPTILPDSSQIGEIAAETLGLELDPYPRRPGETFATAPDQPEEPLPGKVSPFAVLRNKDKR